MSNNKTEAQCPECETWHPVERVTDSDALSGWWWAEATAPSSYCLGCPSCGSIICVESECEFRHAVYSGTSPREFVRWAPVDHRGLEAETGQ